MNHHTGQIDGPGMTVEIIVVVLNHLLYYYL